MTAPACPMCKRPPVTDFRPFCSRRCADLDLQKWLTGAYAIPAGDPDDEEEASSVPEDDEER